MDNQIELYLPYESKPKNENEDKIFRTKAFWTKKNTAESYITHDGVINATAALFSKENIYIGKNKEQKEDIISFGGKISLEESNKGLYLSESVIALGNKISVESNEQAHNFYVDNNGQEGWVINSNQLQYTSSGFIPIQLRYGAGSGNSVFAIRSIGPYTGVENSFLVSTDKGSAYLKCLGPGEFRDGLGAGTTIINSEGIESQDGKFFSFDKGINISNFTINSNGEITSCRNIKVENIIETEYININKRLTIGNLFLSDRRLTNDTNGVYISSDKHIELSAANTSGAITLSEDGISLRGSIRVYSHTADDINWYNPAYSGNVEIKDSENHAITLTFNNGILVGVDQ